MCVCSLNTQVTVDVVQAAGSEQEEGGKKKKKKNKKKKKEKKKKKRGKKQRAEQKNRRSLPSLFPSVHRPIPSLSPLSPCVCANVFVCVCTHTPAATLESFTDYLTHVTSVWSGFNGTG